MLDDQEIKVAALGTKLPGRSGEAQGGGGQWDAIFGVEHKAGICDGFHQLGVELYLEAGAFGLGNVLGREEGIAGFAFKVGVPVGGAVGSGVGEGLGGVECGGPPGGNE